MRTSGRVLHALGREAEAVKCFSDSAQEYGDVPAMAVTEHSELSDYRGLSSVEPGKKAEAAAVFGDMKAFVKREL